MRGRVLQGMVAAVLGGVCLASPARAQNREKAWELYPYLGYAHFGKSAGLKDNTSFGFNFAYNWSKKQEIEFGFGGASTKDKATGQFSADLIDLRVNYIYNIFLQRRDKVAAYVFAGAGAIDFSTFGFTTNLNLVGDEQDFMYNYGAGIRFFGGEKTGLRLGARRVNYSTRRGGATEYTEATLGISIVLGGS